MKGCHFTASLLCFKHRGGDWLHFYGVIMLAINNFHSFPSAFIDWQLAMPSHFLKSTFFKFPFLVVLNMILKLNINLYSSKKSFFFDEVIACQTCTPSTLENFYLLKMTKKSTPFKFSWKMSFKQGFFYNFVQGHLNAI